MFKILCAVSLCFSSHIYSLEEKFPQVIDFSTFDLSEIPGYIPEEWEDLADEYSPFNGAIEFGPYFEYLRNTYNIDTAVETGTWQGETTAFLGLLFNEVHTMEINTEVFQKSLNKLRVYPTIECHYGNSPDILRQILPGLKDKPVLFYLDAHWLSDWPLLEELQVISQTHRDNCIIVVDDFKVPNRPDIPYDAYGNHECSYEYIKKGLRSAFTAYNYYYLIPKSVNARAKFVAIPKKWREQQATPIAPK